MNIHQDPYDPQKGGGPSPFKLTPEDQRIIDDCNKEAFYQRCVPYAIGFSGLTYLGVKAGYFKGHPSYGSAPKAAVAAFIGYFVGKISYQAVCAEKLMAIPNSPLGAVLRSRRQRGGGSFQDSLTLDIPGYSLPEDGSVDVYKDDLSPHTFTDLDTDRPYNQGLDDSHRLNVDSPQRPEDFILPPQTSTPKSYDELRKQNREEFEKKTRAFRSPEDPQRNYQAPRPPPPTAAEEPFERYKPTNVYGDIFEK